ncbi:hypothetical protein [Rhizobium indicum]|uniref:Uncharacterized protein n=1 Tax=Rhizobium indicum TaxID=2583231 RepID=A0ABX6PR09_9HYPH|nr:hypothetical protein [Rhizobium indicum]QKK21053.1 hypothetical protein FFM53_031985 [Rhizobium indicum]
MSQRVMRQKKAERVLDHLFVTCVRECAGRAHDRCQLSIPIKTRVDSSLCGQMLGECGSPHLILDEERRKHASSSTRFNAIVLF